MKDAIKSIVIDELKKHGITDTGVLSAIGSTIATRLDKAIGIDERVVNSALKKVQFHMFVPVNGVRENNNKVTLHNNARKRLTKSITHSRPLKCEVK